MHQTITWANVELSSMGFCGTLLRPISQVFKIPIRKISLHTSEIVSTLPGANGLTTYANDYFDDMTRVSIMQINLSSMQMKIGA